MITANDCTAKYGDPYKENNMVLFQVPKNLQVGNIPKKIYCNKDLVEPLKQAFKNLIDTGKVDELKTWDGCFSIRPMRGGNGFSIHSWGLAIDVNAAENPMGRNPKLSTEFVECWTKAGFQWGGYWNIKDGMHFQLAKI